jgi:hypothetical protein
LLAGVPSALTINSLGFVAGLFIMAFYLWFSINALGRHSNEAISPLQIEDWKNFLRMKIDSRAALKTYPIGDDRAPRAWREAGEDERTCSLFAPDLEKDRKFTCPLHLNAQSGVIGAERRRRPSEPSQPYKHWAIAQLIFL